MTPHVDSYGGDIHLPENIRDRHIDHVHGEHPQTWSAATLP
ncbi:MAG TPA: hypothetical protein VFE72_09245 [Lysobacter sp.]|nr:hypothetical protein [Lysobacter sp.]